MKNNEFLDFKEAKKIVKSLNFNSYSKDWREYCKSENYNFKIPKSPDNYYKKRGWISWADFLGSKNTATLKKTYLKFEEAKKYVHALKLKTQKEWQLFLKIGKRPSNIPAAPERVYKNNGWISFGDWLGTNNISNAKKNKVFLNFKDAKYFVHNLKIKNTKEWNAYCKSGNKPHNIPSTPCRAYNNIGYISMKDWLGTKPGFAGEYMDFNEARQFVHALNLKSINEWSEYSKSVNKPNNLPSDPNRYYKKKGFISMMDWIGTKPGFAGEYMDFNEARQFVHALKLKSGTDWKKYCKSGKKPHNIPSIPNRHYKVKGWISMGDWIGTNFRFIGEWMDFKEARQFVHALKLKSGTDWKKYCKSGKKPYNIPQNPYKVYKNSGWISMGDWLNSGIIATRLVKYISFDEARSIVCNLKLKNFEEYKFWWKQNKPSDMPCNPEATYKEKGWISAMDWIGTKPGFAGEYMDFNEARQFVHALKLKSSNEWLNYCNSGNKPSDIPASPEYIYKNKGFISFGDWLGYLGNGKHLWTKSTLIHFIKSLETELINLDSVELITILNSNNLAKKINEIGLLEAFVSAEIGSKNRKETLKHILNELEKTSEDSFDENFSNETKFNEELIEVDELDFVNEEDVKLKPLNPIAGLHIYDNKTITASLDDENIDFLRKNQLNKLWNSIINKENGITPKLLEKETGGENFSIIKNCFFDEYDKIINMRLPEDYNFRNKNGILINPDLAQLLYAHRLITEKSYGNWSGTGAGKTLSALLAGRIFGAKITIVVCPNATVEGWVDSINEYFINNKVFAKHILEGVPKNNYNIFKKYDIKLNNEDNNYLVINYETFQQDDSEYIIYELLRNNIIEHIIIDEVQNVKQREVKTQSTRRDVVNKLIIASREKNNELLVSVMSATPVINNLYEPKALIELLTTESHNELEIKENIVNGVEMYKALTRYGLRYRPKHDIYVHEEIIEVDGSHLADTLIKISKGDILEFEKTLLQTKLNAIKDKIQKGTLIYSHYVTDIIYVVGDYIKQLGFTVGYYTGDDKLGLKKFKEGKVDVLIGSAPIGTGVNGIQKVCNTIIKLILPWTSAENKQIDGRAVRRDSNFDKVAIYTPVITIQTDKGEWSWDRRRFNIIKFKATLADLVVDGRIPKNLLPPKTKLLEDAKKELQIWLNRLKNDDIITFEREELKVPLNPIFIKKMHNDLGEISQMHKDWVWKKTENVNKIFNDNPEKWFYYHTLRRDKIKSWPEDPLLIIANKLKLRPDWIVADFGCGENRLRQEIKNTIYAFDHVAIDESVIACDVSHVPLEDTSVDVVVCCLSLWGTNWEEQIKEANRILKPYGRIFIAEKSSRWESRESIFKEKIENHGFQCFDAMRNTGRFIYLNGEKI